VHPNVSAAVLALAAAGIFIILLIAALSDHVTI
jgi:hypothetical protein